MTNPSVLSEFMKITHPDLPSPSSSSPTIYFTTAELIQSTGLSRKVICDCLDSGLLVPSIERGRRGAGNGDESSHKFSERDLLIAAAISSFPSRSHVERKRLSEALYATPTLHRYILVTATATRLFDSLASFADPVEWSHPLIYILDLRTLWKDIERRVGKYALKSFNKTIALEEGRLMPKLVLPSGERVRRLGSSENGEMS